MRKLFVVLAVVFTVIGIVFTILPLGTLAFLPIGLALLFAILAFKNAETTQKKLPKLLVFIASLTLLVVFGKEILIKDEVIKDESFEKTKVESENDAVETLENELE